MVAYAVLIIFADICLLVYLVTGYWPVKRRR
jgi:uncharacterized protein YneF (UPF0154 family)